jgi:hypothetical protein
MTLLLLVSLCLQNRLEWFLWRFMPILMYFLPGRQQKTR